MRIEDTRLRELENKRGFRKSKLNSSDKPELFSMMIEEEKQVSHNSKTDLEELKREIDETGAILEQNPSIEEFNYFRDLIKTLTEKVSKEAYRLRTVGFSFSNKEYNIVQVINEELNSLYKLIMSEHKNHLAIVNRVIKIKGLVVDILS